MNFEKEKIRRLWIMYPGFCNRKENTLDENCHLSTNLDIKFRAGYE